MILDEYIQSLKNYKGFAGDIVCHKTLDPVPAVFADSPVSLKNNLSDLLNALGIEQLYSHQKTAIQMIRQGIHTVIATPTASGKSLIYNLPVIDALMDDHKAHALYLFPLKALARDQLDTVEQLLVCAGQNKKIGSKLTAAVYDGDITSYQKSKIRKRPPHILLSNPEMLHLAMLAHHRLWEDFFKGLKYVVIDEVHTYRGVMGSNMAWVFRRLRRICQLYGAQPVFIFCSATIANPEVLAAKLTGLKVQVVKISGSPSGKKQVLLMRGLEGAAQTAIALIHSAVHRNLRTIVYTQSRKITELIAMWVSQKARQFKDKISAYRAGFLPEERREIEKKLSTGELLAVVTTSALELGIDIGNLDICILVGYPGTIMSTWQRAGRVGRDGKDSALILIAHEDALDQYFINHPDVFFNSPPETAMINPDNPVILRQHLECAAAELSLERTEPFLDDPGVQKALKELEYSGKLLRTFQGDLWFAARKSPHRDVSLRGTGNILPIFLEETRQCLGDIDRHRSFFETHEGAVYLHRGQTYVICKFDHEKGIIQARSEEVNYFTKALSSKHTTIIEHKESIQFNNARVGFGILKIIEQVTGYDRRLVSSQKSIGIIPLNLPRLEFETTGFWIEISDEIRDCMEINHMHFMGGIHALEHAAIGIMPLLVMIDRNDIGGISIPFHPQVGKAAVFIYDGVPGGLGLSEQAFKKTGDLLQKTFEVISSCPCDIGCPACVHSPKCGSGNRPIDKQSAIDICRMLLAETNSPCQVQDPIISIPAAQDLPADKVDKSDELPMAFVPLPLQDFSYSVLDIETRRSAQEVGGWNKAEHMGVSVAIRYDSRTQTYHEYFQDDIEQLAMDLETTDLVIGFNIIRFDYKVLSGLSAYPFHALPTLDILMEVHKRLGYRLSLDALASQTLGAQKSADGLMALQWWQQGELDKIVEYCKQDVKVTKDLYLYGQDHKFLVFKNKAGHKVRLPVDW
ncbi:MAG: DEAD/DEAH box helicase [Pseudomonadota bacterium]